MRRVVKRIWPLHKFACLKQENFTIILKPNKSMDNHKRKVIHLVKLKANPVIWDPKNPDYKNRDMRKQVWAEIDDQLPQSEDYVSSKTIWDQMTRGFSNALRRKDKRHDNDIVWKFERDMMFLLPAKKQRMASSIYPETGVDSNEDSSDSFLGVHLV